MVGFARLSACIASLVRQSSDTDILSIAKVVDVGLGLVDAFLGRGREDVGAARHHFDCPVRLAEVEQAATPGVFEPMPELLTIVDLVYYSTPKSWSNRKFWLSYYVTIVLLWWIEPKIDWNRLLPTIESKNLVAIMIVSNSRTFAQ